MKYNAIERKTRKRSSTLKLCLVPENLRENIRERKYKGKVEGKKK